MFVLFFKIAPKIHKNFVALQIIKPIFFYRFNINLLFLFKCSLWRSFDAPYMTSCQWGKNCMAFDTVWVLVTKVRYLSVSL